MMSLYVSRFAPKLTNGAKPTDAAVSAGDSAREAAHTADPLAKIKARLGWRDEKTEAKWMKETGWTLLSLAAGFNDLAAVTHLASQPGAAKDFKKKVKMLKPSTPLRKQPFSMLLAGSLSEFDCLTAASAFGDVAVIKALLAAGCPANVRRPRIDLATSVHFICFTHTSRFGPLVLLATVLARSLDAHASRLPSVALPCYYTMLAHASLLRSFEQFGAACGIVGCWCEGGVRGGKPENVAAILEHDPSIVYGKDTQGLKPAD